MLKIFKYPLVVKDHQEIYLPKGCEILSVRAQRNKIVLYAMVNPDEQETDAIEVQIRGTGHPSDSLKECQFMDTVMIHNESLVFHVFVKRL